jgi:hypothetical protein
MIRDFRALDVNLVPVLFNPVKIFGPAVGGGKSPNIRNVVYIKNKKPDPGIFIFMLLADFKIRKAKLIVPVFEVFVFPFPAPLKYLNDKNYNNSQK